MKKRFLDILACPKCEGTLSIENITEVQNDQIVTGELFCSTCNKSYPIIRNIPRFVPIENYASNFGIEWMAHSQTQYDSYCGIDISKKRFFEETKWSKNLEQELILEVGSGSGRFTEQAASTGALVISMDYSYAVEANYQSNGNKNNVFIVQGDIFSIPFKKKIFDKLFCIGVLQHTPNPHKAFLGLPPYLKPKGKLVVDIYKKGIEKFIFGKYWVRPFTKKTKNPERLYKRIKKYINFMWPISKVIRKIPIIGPSINWRLLVADYSALDLDDEMLKEWAYLDSYDMLSPRYDYPKTLKTFKKWFKEANLKEIDVHYGYNGIEGRGTIN
jgi:uncharacterized protein YbaR (Trm112 family)/ubiquinone/menaquinone biosynthesis C-methylase UbiE